MASRAVGSFHTGLAARRGRMLADMTIQRMDNVAIVVDDLDAAVAFFTELGMELEGKGQIEGLWADRTVGLNGVRSEIAMMRTPDGHSKLELTKYHAPAVDGASRRTRDPTCWLASSCSPSTTSMNVARLRAHGAELLGEVAQYESIFLLCYLRGPAGIIVALAEQIGIEDVHRQCGRELCGRARVKMRGTQEPNRSSDGDLPSAVVTSPPAGGSGSA